VSFSRIILWLLIFSSCHGGEKAFVFDKSVSIGQASPLEIWKFSPEFALDGKVTTAFCVDAKKSESSFTFYFGNQFSFKAIQIANGYGKSYSSSLEKGYLTKVRVTSFDISDRKKPLQTNNGIILNWKPPRFKENHPLSDFYPLNETLKGNALHFEVLETSKGSKGLEACLSEIQFGEIKGDIFTAYPILNEEAIRRAIAGYEESSKHFFAFRKFLTTSNGLEQVFHDLDSNLTTVWKMDETFSMALDDKGEQIQGKFTAISSNRDGLELVFNYLDPSQGIERSDTFWFKRASPGDEDFERYKTWLGPQFSDIVDFKNKYLLVLKAQGSNFLGDRTFYHYDLPLK